MGFAKPLCVKKLIDFEHPSVDINIQCEKTTYVAQVLDAGLLLSISLPEGTDNTLATCNSNSFAPGSVSEELNTKYFDYEAFEADFMKDCREDSSMC